MVVLAGGPGSRLAPLTTALYGHPVPKQFAALVEGKSLLAMALERGALLAPPERTIVVTTQAQAPQARAIVETFPGVGLALQPRGLDTAAAILFALALVGAREPDARVIFLPSDHYVPEPAPLVRSLREACLSHRVTLIGLKARGAETEYGWILPGPPWSGRHRCCRRVEAFVEKPPIEAARALLARGALWNSFVSVGPIHAYWDLCAEHLPCHARKFGAYGRAIGTDRECAAVATAFEGLEPASFSARVLEPAAAKLAVIGCDVPGWCDWGTPRRVFHSLEGTPALSALIGRLRARLVDEPAGAR